MTKCTLCQIEIEGMMLGCSKGYLCKNCQDNINLAQYQPLHSNGDILWVLAETYFRKGKGEDVTFEQVWDEKQNLKLVKFEYLFDMERLK